MDDRQRSLLREYEQDGSLVSGSSYLQWCLRTGVLSETELRLAARCNDQRAQLALGEVQSQLTMRPWLQVVKNEFEPEVSFRLAWFALTRRKGCLDPGVSRYNANRMALKHIWGWLEERLTPEECKKRWGMSYGGVELRLLDPYIHRLVGYLSLTDLRDLPGPLTWTLYPRDGTTSEVIKEYTQKRALQWALRSALPHENPSLQEDLK